MCIPCWGRESKGEDAGRCDACPCEEAELLLLSLLQFWRTMKRSSSWTRRSVSWTSPTRRWKLPWWSCSRRFVSMDVQRSSQRVVVGALDGGLLTLPAPCSADLQHGEEPEEHWGGKQNHRGAKRSPVPGALRVEPGSNPKSCQYPPSAHGKKLCWRPAPVGVMEGAEWNRA